MTCLATCTGLCGQPSPSATTHLQWTPGGDLSVATSHRGQSAWPLHRTRAENACKDLTHGEPTKGPDKRMDKCRQFYVVVTPEIHKMHVTLMSHIVFAVLQIL